MRAPRLHAHIEIDTSRLRGVSDRATDLRKAWMFGVQPIVTEFLQRRFQTEGAYLGEKWAALAPATVALRSQSGRGRGGIGRDTNRLWASLVKSAGASAAPEGVLDIGPTTYERGTTVPYARFFAGGYTSKTVPVQTAKGWRFVRRKPENFKHVPARPIFPDPMPKQLTESVEAVLKRYIVGGVV